MICNRQLEAGKILADKEGLLDDDSYIAGLPPAERPQNQNVATLAISASAGLLAQFVSFTAAPAGIGEPGPLRYALSTHWLKHVEETTQEFCSVERGCGRGDRRNTILHDHPAAREEVRRRRRESSRPIVKIARIVDAALVGLRAQIERAVVRVPAGQDTLAQQEDAIRSSKGQSRDQSEAA